MVLEINSFISLTEHFSTKNKQSKKKISIQLLQSYLFYSLAVSNYTPYSWFSYSSMILLAGMPILFCDG